MRNETTLARSFAPRVARASVATASDRVTKPPTVGAIPPPNANGVLDRTADAPKVNAEEALDVREDVVATARHRGLALVKRFRKR